MSIYFGPVSPNKYHQTYDISHALVGNKIVNHSDVVGASPVDAAPTTSSFSKMTFHFFTRQPEALAKETSVPCTTSRKDATQMQAWNFYTLKLFAGQMPLSFNDNIWIVLLW